MILQAKRIILRNWNNNDIGALVEGLGNFEVARWLARVRKGYDRNDAQAWIERANSKGDYEFAIDLDGKAIGGVGLQIREGVGFGGIWINPKYRGQGYGREAMNERIRFGFEIGVKHFESGYFEGNEASKKMHESLGFKDNGQAQLYNEALGKMMLEYKLILRREDWRN